MNDKLDLQELLVGAVSSLDKMEQHLIKLRAVIDAVEVAVTVDKQIALESDDEATFNVGASDERDVTSTKPVSFVLKGTRYKVGDWNRMGQKLCEILHDEDSSLFLQAVQTVQAIEDGRYSSAFSNSKKDRYWLQVKRTDTYVWGGSAKRWKEIAFALVDKFSGYNALDLYIECRNLEREPKLSDV